MKTLPPAYLQALIELSNVLKGKNYCIRGTVGLVLQGYDMGVDDLDILTDKNTAFEANRLLKEYIVLPVEYRETDQFKSYFGKFKLKEVPCEMFGEWEIKDQKGVWSKKYIPSEVVLVSVGEVTLPVCPIGTELEVYAKMGRWNVLHKIRKQMASKEDSLTQPGIFDNM